MGPFFSQYVVSFCRFKSSVSRVKLGGADYVEYSFNLTLNPFEGAMSTMLRLRNVEIASECIVVTELSFFCGGIH